ncbi:MAG: SLC13 family permease [Paracoccaceae bacterium]|jgi:di/tricarboxylate transporter
MIRTLTITQAFAFGAVACSLVTLVISSDMTAHILALSLTGIVLFATRALPEVVTSFAIFLSFLALGVAPPDLIFAGFLTNGFWLLIGGLVIGAAIGSSGLGDQVAVRIFVRTGSSYVRAVWFLSLAGIGFSLLVPSAIPRVIVMMPITLALARTMGFAPGSRGHVGLMITAVSMTMVPTYAFLTANLPTIVELGAVEVLYGVHIRFGEFFVQQAPLNVVRFTVLLLLLLWMGRDLTAQKFSEMQIQPLKPAQWRLLIVLGLAITLWATDIWHGIAPAWVSLCAGMILLWPGFGVMPPQAMKNEIDLSMAFFIAAVFCISGVVTHSGLGDKIAQFVVPALHLGQGNSLHDLVTLVVGSSVLSHLTTAPAAGVVLAPLASSMAEATGWSIKTIAMVHNAGFSTTIFPYQSPPLLIGVALAQIPIGALTRICFLTTVIATAVGLPLTWLWWSWLGLI